MIKSFALFVLFSFAGCSTDTGLVEINGWVSCENRASCSNYIKERIRNKWKNPANFNGVFQKARFEVTLSPAGTVNGLKKVNSSGSVDFDNLAEVAINYASPYMELMRPDIQRVSKYKKMLVEFEPDGKKLIVTLL